MRRSDAALGVCGLLLAGLLAAELLPAAAETGTPDPAAAEPAAADMPAPAAAPPLGAWADTALGRPIFTQDRRPQASAAAQHGLPRLTGTIRTDDSLLAIFAPEGNARPLVVGRDATVAGWTVAEITDGEVTLLRDGRSDRLRLSYANLPPPAPPPAKGPATVLLHTKRTDAFLQP